MNSKPGFEFAAPWWRGTRLSYSSGGGTLVVELPDREALVYHDVPAQVYEILKHTPELRPDSVTDDGPRYAIAEAC